MKTKYWYWIWRTFLGPSRLRRKFVRTFLLAGLIPLVLMGAVSVYLVNLTHKIDVAAIEQNVVEQAALEITKFTSALKADLTTTVTFEDFAPIRFSEQQFVLGTILDRYPSLLEVSYICTTEALCEVGNETQRLARTENGGVASISLRNRIDDPAFIQGKTGTPYFGNIQSEDGNESIAAAWPVFNKRHEVIAVLSGNLSIAAMTQNAVGARLGTTGYVYIVDENGKIIAHPQQELLGSDVSAIPAVQQTFRSEKEPSKTSSLTYRNAAGVTVSGMGIRVPELNWAVIAEWPRTETQSLIRTILFQIGGFSLLAFILIAIIASWVALKLIEPIAALRQGTSIIGGGNFNYRVQLKTGDELEDLGANLNKMAENLKGIEEVRELRIRTQALTESLKKEQELSKLKDQFITTVSHQFNTPLSVIKWALDSLGEKTGNPSDVRSAKDIIAKSQQDIVGIVNDLVTLTQVGFRYEKSNVKPVDVRTLVAKSLDYLAEIIRGKKLTVNIRATGNTLVPMNEFMVGKAIDNVIDNAVAYSNDGGKIAIEIGGTDKELTLTITDRGIGIPKEDQPSIFQQFFRAKNAVAKKNVGTGLGLFITKTIIEGHGGRVWFTSTENQGSSFSIALPR